MAVLLALVVIAAFSKRWPGCAPRKGPPTDQRDWRAWYKNLKSWSDINVHVYREPPFNWLHPNCTNLEHPEFDMYPQFKHSDDYHFARQAMDMPSSDPNNATVFLIPAFLNMYAAAAYGAHDYHLSWKKFCCDIRGVKKCHKDLADELGIQLEKSEWFQRRGGFDHLLVASHWNIGALGHLFWDHSALSAVSQINFEDTRPSPRAKNSLALRGMYIAKRCPKRRPTRSTPPKYMGFHFIGDIPHKSQQCQQNYVECPPMFLSGGGIPSGRDLRVKYCSAISKLPKSMLRRSFCASSSYVQPAFGDHYCTKNVTVSCSLKATKSAIYWGSHQKGGSDITESATDTTYCDSIHKATFGLHIRGNTLGSSRLWDALDSGAIPVFTQPEQYDLLPFKSLWPSMSFMVFYWWDQLGIKALTEELFTFTYDAMGRWSSIMDAMAIGKLIVSWIEPGSVTLRAYIQLLVDRINGMHCGPCVRSEARKERCKLPRCERSHCTWSPIDKYKGCHVNADGMLPDDKLRHETRYTLRDCQIECEKDRDCNAVAYEIGAKQHKCMLFRKACKFPLAPNWGSYAMSGPPPGT